MSYLLSVHMSAPPVPYFHFMESATPVTVVYCSERQGTLNAHQRFQGLQHKWIVNIKKSPTKRKMCQ